jgi:thioredoxin
MVREVMQDELEKLIHDKKIVIVDFSATWCGPCKSLGKVLETKIAPVYENDADVALVKVDIDKNQELAQALQVLSVPTMMFFFGGQRIVFQGEEGKQEDRIVGFDPNMDKILFSLVDELKKTPVPAHSDKCDCEHDHDCDCGHN